MSWKDARSCKLDKKPKRDCWRKHVCVSNLQPPGWVLDAKKGKIAGLKFLSVISYQSFGLELLKQRVWFKGVWFFVVFSSWGLTEGNLLQRRRYAVTSSGGYVQKENRCDGGGFQLCDQLIPCRSIPGVRRAAGGIGSRAGTDLLSVRLGGKGLAFLSSLDGGALQVF